MADDAMPVVEIERQGDVLRPVAKKIAGEPGGRDRIVDSSRQSEPRLEDGIRMHLHFGSPSERPDEAVERRCDGHDRDLRERWIHGGPPPHGLAAEPRTALSASSHGWRVELDQPGEYW
ncbi:MAG: hypothetical protein ACYCSX_10065 [Acidimicrobiales bacterium]